MKRHGSLLGLLLVLAALVGGLAWLFQMRVAHGDMFPAYSSLRADPLGTRALHDALARVAGLRVERNYQPVHDLESSPARTIVFAGMRRAAWTNLPREDFDALDAALRSGSRVVLALRAETARTPEERDEERATAAERARRLKKVDPENKQPKFMPVDFRRRWGVDVKERMLMDRGAGARRTDDDRATGLPEALQWKSDVFFALEPDADWHVIYRRGSEPVLAERQLGHGSLVLVADSYVLSNEALQNNRASSLLTWVIGPHARVVFDEAHLGVVARVGVAALARRYGLSGAFFMFLLLAGLFIWRRMALFVPPAESEAEVALSYHPAAGLEALMRRALTTGELAAACTAEWRTTARESDRARVEAAFATAPGNAAIATQYNRAVQSLRKRSAAPATISPPPPPRSSS